MKKNILILVAIMFAPFAFSDGVEDLHPSFVGCNPNGACMIGVDPGSTTSTCPNNGQIRFDISLAGSQPQYMAALAALTNDKVIRVHLTDKCIDGFPTVDWLYVKSTN